MMRYYLGIDIGTGSSKAIAFTGSGKILCSHALGYQMLHPQIGWCEQDPDHILNAVVGSINKVLDQLSPSPPLFISFSSVLHSLIAVDKDGALLTNNIIWADNRAADLAHDLGNTSVGKSFYHATGVPVHCMSPFSKLLWLKQYRHDLFERAYKFIGIKEYILNKLLGAYVVDSSVASGTGLLNINTLKWDEEILNYAGIKSSQLSEVVSPTKILNYHGSYVELLLPDNIPFIIGASDGALSNLGSGAMLSHQMAITIGTSSAARIITDQPITDNEMRTFCYHLEGERYIAGGASNNGGVVLDWLKDSIFKNENGLEALLEEAALIPVGSEGLLFLPYILGERSPLWNANAKGVFFGLTIQHKQSHLMRAAIEAIMSVLYSIGKIVMEKRSITELRASGGFAKSPFCLQVLADIFNIKVVVSNTNESAALGAVMLGTMAVGIKSTFEDDILSQHFPIKSNTEHYKRQFKRFTRLYELLKLEMSDGIQ